jgi:hypothetical protein
MAKDPAIRARLRLEGAVELEYLQKHIAEWARLHPELVRTAMFAGANELKDEVYKNMHSMLRTRTGKLQAALARSVVTLPDGGVDAEVYLEPGAGGLQPVKMRALELGSYRQHPGGVPYVMIGGRARWITKDEAAARESEGKHVLRTQGPYNIRVGRHPVFRDSLRKKRIQIAQEILHEILEGFKRERARGAVA